MNAMPGSAQVGLHGTFTKSTCLVLPRLFVISSSTCCSNDAIGTYEREYSRLNRRRREREPPSRQINHSSHSHTCLIPEQSLITLLIETLEGCPLVSANVSPLVVPTGDPCKARCCRGVTERQDSYRKIGTFYNAVIGNQYKANIGGIDAMQRYS